MLGGGIRLGIVGGFIFSFVELVGGSSGVKLGGPNSAADDASFCSDLVSIVGEGGISALGGFGGGTFLGTAVFRKAGGDVFSAS